MLHKINYDFKKKSCILLNISLCARSFAHVVLIFIIHLSNGIIMKILKGRDQSL